MIIIVNFPFLVGFPFSLSLKDQFWSFGVKIFLFKNVFDNHN